MLGIMEECTSDGKKEGGLGFRKLSNFNKALIDKQACRLLINPGSLVASMYKARYYKNSNLLDTMRRLNPSYIWKSIMASRDLIRGGARWRIGNGENVRI